jgi:hypothetical protein
VEESLDLDQNLRLWRDAQDELAARFGFPLKRPLLVVLFPTWAELGRLFEREMGAFALVGGDAVVIAANTLLAWENQDELARHELAHLFSASWGWPKPSLKGEGLAVWLQGTQEGKQIEFHALTSMLGEPTVPLSVLLNEGTFFANSAASYALAGGFTGFLIRRVGWDTYQQFFRNAMPRNFRAVFKRVFGITLLAAEREWRRDLLEQRAAFEPDLQRAVAERRARVALNSRQLFRSLEDCEALLRTEPDSVRVLLLVSSVHAYLGHYPRAAEACERILAGDDPALRFRKAGAYLHLGKLYDVMNRREEALQAYRRCLEEPDEWSKEKGSTHAQARKRLKRPHTERELRARLLSGWNTGR